MYSACHSVGQYNYMYTSRIQTEKYSNHPKLFQRGQVVTETTRSACSHHATRSDAATQLTLKAMTIGDCRVQTNHACHA